MDKTIPYGKLPASVRAHISKARQKTNQSLRSIKHARLTAKTPIRFSGLATSTVGYECLGRLGGLHFDSHPELLEALGL